GREAKWQQAKRAVAPDWKSYVTKDYHQGG
ncbi:unnamed protein product, partial [marine sediment metagenome]